MIGNGDCHCAEIGLPLHDDVASASTDFLKTVLFEDTADISSRKDAKLTHEPLQSG